MTASAFDNPLYGDKPRRTIPGTTAVAVTMYRSSDGSVREYAIFTADGLGWLGKAYWQSPKSSRQGGYTMVQFPRLADGTEYFQNLAAFATEMAQRNGLDVNRECHAARTGEGYWTCDVSGGCPDCRTLAVEIEDREQIAEWNSQRTGLDVTKEA